MWNCTVDSLDPSSLSRIDVHALIDHGSPAVLIEKSLIACLCLTTCLLPHPFPVSGVFFDDSVNSSNVLMTHWVKLKLHDHENLYSAHTVCALTTPKLCHSIILGLPFLSHNHIVIDARNDTAIDYNCGFDLLHPVPHVIPSYCHRCAG